ncbi:hypothetical protein B0H11DRAFT_2002484 [Mycena galericulata]|nr:hypothetical protein B0H11DRAFT_2002484 [Mycena galericulata]
MGWVHAGALWTELVLDHLLPHWTLVWKTGYWLVGVLLLVEMGLADLLVLLLLDDAGGEGIGEHGIAVSHCGGREPRLVVVVV